MSSREDYIYGDDFIDDIEELPENHVEDLESEEFEMRTSTSKVPRRSKTMNICEFDSSSKLSPREKQDLWDDGSQYLRNSTEFIGFFQDYKTHHQYHATLVGKKLYLGYKTQNHQN